MMDTKRFWAIITNAGMMLVLPFNGNEIDVSKATAGKNVADVICPFKALDRDHAIRLIYDRYPGLAEQNKTQEDFFKDDYAFVQVNMNAVA